MLLACTTSAMSEWAAHEAAAFLDAHKSSDAHETGRRSTVKVSIATTTMEGKDSDTVGDAAPTNRVSKGTPAPPAKLRLLRRPPRCSPASR